MVNIKTAIHELNTGKIEFDYKDDDCCTTEGEVAILLKRLAELENADVEEVVRCKDCKNYKDTGVCTAFQGLSCIENPKTNFCSYGERRDA